MAHYQPAWRRPIAELFRRTAHVPVRWCVRCGIHPNVISCSSIVAAAAAGACFWQASAAPMLLLVAIGFCYVRLWLNMLDGMVALAAGKASRTGEIANEFPDRVSDVLIFAGVAHSGLCNPLAGYWAALFALLVAYVGTLGLAVGVQREFSGWMAKPWRMVALHVGAWLMLVMLWAGDDPARFGAGTILDWTLLAIIGGCVQTICVRLVKIIRVLQNDVSPLAGPETPSRD